MMSWHNSICYCTGCFCRA